MRGSAACHSSPDCLWGGRRSAFSRRNRSCITGLTFASNPSPRIPCASSCAQSSEDRKRDDLCSFGPVPGRPDTRRASVPARASADEFARAFQQHVRKPIEWLAETDPTRIGVVEIKVRFKELSYVRCARCRKILPVDLGSCAGRTLPHRSAKISPVAHEQESSYGSQGIEQSKDAVLSLGKRERQFPQQTAPQRQPESRRVHLVLRQFELSRADVLVREELDLLEAHNLRA